tara:strand:+ start:643 stop:1230 length:588 start_codon:yes stop_codon:yes gene_type:complete
MSNFETIEEPKLLQRLAKGDETAFRSIYDRYWNMVYTTSLKFLYSNTTAEDIVQDIFSKVWIHRKDLENVQNLEAYLKVITKNHLYSEFRKWAVEERRRDLFLNQSNFTTSDADYLILNQEYAEMLHDAVAELPDRQREIFLLSRTEGFSHEKIAEMLNLSQGTVKNHMVRALHNIKQKLSPILKATISLLLIFG